MRSGRPTCAGTRTGRSVVSTPTRTTHLVWPLLRLRAYRTPRTTASTDRIVVRRLREAAAQQWINEQTGVAGVSGVMDWRGQMDAFGGVMNAVEMAVVHEVLELAYFRLHGDFRQGGLFLFEPTEDSFDGQGWRLSIRRRSQPRRRRPECAGSKRPLGERRSDF